MKVVAIISFAIIIVWFIIEIIIRVCIFKLFFDVVINNNSGVHYWNYNRRSKIGGVLGKNEAATRNGRRKRKIGTRQATRADVQADRI